MAVPKKKTSQQRKALRRAGHTHKLKPIYTMACPNCGEAVLPLYVCPSCGHYKGKEIIAFAEEVAEDADSSES